MSGGSNIFLFFPYSVELMIVTPSFFFRNWHDTFSAYTMSQIYSTSSWITPGGSVCCRFPKISELQNRFQIFFIFFKWQTVKKYNFLWYHLSQIFPIFFGEWLWTSIMDWKTGSIQNPHTQSPISLISFMEYIGGICILSFSKSNSGVQTSSQIFQKCHTQS